MARRAALEWPQDNPNYMWFTELGKPKQLLTRGGADLGPTRRRSAASRAAIPRATSRPSPRSTPRPPGRSGRSSAGQPVPDEVVYPTIEDGVTGVAFVDACVRSSSRNGAWVTL